MEPCLAAIYALGVIPVITIGNADDAVPLCQALSDGGLPVAEITFRTEAAAEAIRQARASLPDMYIGAGTVTSVGMAETAVACGARFIVSPGFSPEVVSWCVKHGVPVFPGCATASEVESAMNLGLKAVKFFPAEPNGGLRAIKALSGPYPSMKFMPTGGISLHNIEEYLANDHVLACGGSFMVPGDAVRAKDWAAIRALAEEGLAAAQGVRLEEAGPLLADPERAAARFAAFMPAPAVEATGTPGAVWRVGSMVAGTVKDRDAAFHMVFSVTSLERTLAYLAWRGTAPGAVERSGNGKALAVTLPAPVCSCVVTFRQR